NVFGTTTCNGWNEEPSERWTNEMPAFESRRVRTQPLTVTAKFCGACPARTSRTLNSFWCIDRDSLFGVMPSLADLRTPVNLPSVRSTFRRHRARAAILVDGDIGENALGDRDLLLSNAAPHPTLDLDRDRGAPDFDDFRVTGHLIPNENRPM